jgi:spermidine synthase
MLFGAIPRVVEALGLVSTWWGHVMKLLVVAGVVMLVPTFLMGMLFPIAGKLQVLSLDTVGRKIGGIYAANTTGAIFGAFTAGFVLIPLIGTQWSIQLLAWINLAIGAVVIVLDTATRPVIRSAALVVVAVPALLLTLLPSPDYLIDQFRPGSGSELLYHEEGAAGTVTVLEYENGNRLLRVNGAGEVPTDYPSIQIFRMLGSLPLLIHPAPDDVLVIAFGGGVTLASVERQQPRHIDCVEVVSGVVGAAPFFSEYNNDVFERLEEGSIDLIFEDGRNHVLRTRKTYDVIISDSTHPLTADSWVLYTRDFYELCRSRLRDGGYMAQWLPMHGLTVRDYKMIVRTFHSVFPHSSLWLNTGYSVLLGAPERLRIDYDRLRSGLESPAVGTSLEAVHLGDAISFLAALALEEDAIPRYVGEGPINTDDLQYLSFRGRLRSDTAHGNRAMISLLPYLVVSPGSTVDATPAELRALERRLQSRRHMLTGVAARKLGDQTRALRELRRSRDLDPGNSEAERILKATTRGSQLADLR